MNPVIPQAVIMELTTLVGTVSRTTHQSITHCSVHQIHLGHQPLCCHLDHHHMDSHLADHLNLLGTFPTWWITFTSTGMSNLGAATWTTTAWIPTWRITFTSTGTFST